MKDKYDKLEETVDKPEDIEPIKVEHEYEIDGYVHDPGMPVVKTSRWDRLKLSLVSGTTFDFLRHFIIGFAGIGGTVVATTGNLAWALVAGVAGGLVEGGRKVWSTSTAAKNGGTKNRILEAVLQLIVAIIDRYLQKKREEVEK